MKLNLLYDDPGGARSGYVNVDPLAPPGCPARTMGQLGDLSALADRGEVTELVAHDVLGLFDARGARDCAAHWAGLLAHGGLLAVSEPDLGEVARAYLSGALDAAGANELVNGRRRSVWDMESLAALFEGAGLSRLTCSFTALHVVLTFRRP